MWIYVNRNLLLGASSKDMTGNTGWIPFAGEIPERLRDSNGVPMYAYDNGNLRERTAQERAANRHPRPKMPNEAERLSVLENAFAEFVEVMLNG